MTENMIHIPACMGGWCRKRETCADYHAEGRHELAERLCAKGHDNPQPINRKNEEGTEHAEN